jgi:hypothetical protein
LLSPTAIVVEDRGMERRIGTRHPVGWLQVTWSVLRRGRWRTAKVEEHISAIDVSTSGMAVRAQTVPNLMVGQPVQIRLGGHLVTARVRRIAPTVDPEATDYGLEFVDPPLEFIETLMVQSGAAAADNLEIFWQHAG